MFDPELFFSQAERLAQPNLGEEDYRTAVSRAYYACHLTARDRLFGIDAVDWGAQGGRPSHYAVIAASVASSAGGIDGRPFRWLKQMREKADYVRDPDHPEVRQMFANYGVRDWAGLASEALVIARNLLPVLRQLQPTP